MGNISKRTPNITNRDLYWVKKWPYSSRFQDLIKNLIPAMNKYLIYFEYILIDINKFEKRKLVQMRNAVVKLFYIEKMTNKDINHIFMEIIEIIKSEMGEMGDLLSPTFTKF